MKKPVTLFVIFIISYCSFYPLICVAGKNVKFNVPALNYSGPADNANQGVTIGKEWTSTIIEPRICQTNSLIIARANIIALSPPTNLTADIDGVNYPVYETGTEGIGWVMGVKDTFATNFSAVKLATNQWYPAPGTSTEWRESIGGTLKITFVKTAQHLNSGQTSLHGNDIARISCFTAANNGNREADSGIISLNTAAITIKALGCNVLGSNSSTVSLGDFSVAQFKAVNSTQGNVVAHTSISCDKNVNVKVTVSDQTDQSNRTNIIKLSSDSTASGIGIQALYQGNVVTLGPDDSSKATKNQFTLLTTTTDKQVIPFDLAFRYIRTGDIKAGIANGLVGITFSYQ